MRTERIMKETKSMLLAGMICGVVLLVLGIVFTVLDAPYIPNKKGLIGTSFLPLSVAFVYYLKWKKLKNAPEKMKQTIIMENDERLIATKNEVNSKAFKIMQGAIGLCYFSYTFIVPEDVFSVMGWWMIMTLMLLSLLLPVVLNATSCPD